MKRREERKENSKESIQKIIQNLFFGGIEWCIQNWTFLSIKFKQMASIEIDNEKE